jgi:hypothetical protein
MTAAERSQGSRSTRRTLLDMPDRVPWWALASSAAAPVLLIGGWTLAAGLQRREFDQVAQTISALAADGAGRPWVMTAALGGVGVCHVVTALGLRAARLPGRAVLAAGGVATCLVAAFPLPTSGGSVAHTVAATVSFGALAVWPALAYRRAQGTPVTLRRLPSWAAAGVLVGLDLWFAAELPGERIGLAERVAAGAQSLWPLLVVLGARRVVPASRRLA